MENPTNESQPEEVDVASADGAEAVPEPVSEESPEPSAEDAAIQKAVDSPDATQEDALLEQVNNRLGKNFKDLDSALGSWKELQTSFSKLQQPAKAPVAKGNEEFVSRSEFDSEMYLKDNPEIDRGLAEMVAKNEGISIREAVSHDSYKQYATKVKGYDDAQAAKSVLQSNPRLGAIKDKMGKAREEMDAARKSTDPSLSISHQAKAEENAVDAVLDAYSVE